MDHPDHPGRARRGGGAGAGPGRPGRHVARRDAPLRPALGHSGPAARLRADGRSAGGAAGADVAARLRRSRSERPARHARSASRARRPRARVVRLAPGPGRAEHRPGVGGEPRQPRPRRRRGERRRARRARPEPFASRLVADGHATVLVDLRTPGRRDAGARRLDRQRGGLRARRPAPRDQDLDRLRPRRARRRAADREATGPPWSRGCRRGVAAPASSRRAWRRRGGSTWPMGWSRRPAPRDDRADPGHQPLPVTSARTAAGGDALHRAAAPGPHGRPGR